MQIFNELQTNFIRMVYFIAVIGRLLHSIPRLLAAPPAILVYFRSYYSIRHRSTEDWTAFITHYRIDVWTKTGSTMPTSSSTQCWFLVPIALALLCGGGAALFLLSIPSVRQFATVRHFRSSGCRVIAVHHFGNRSCSPVTSSPSSVFYPCVVVVVRYSVDEKPVDAEESNATTVGRAMLDRSAVLYRSVADADETRQTIDLNGDISNTTVYDALFHCNLRSALVHVIQWGQLWTISYANWYTFGPLLSTLNYTTYKAVANRT